MRQLSEARRSASPSTVTIVDAEQLGGVMTEKLAELFDEEATAKRGGRSASKIQAHNGPIAARGARAIR